jgi:GxxExxY protein
VFSGAAWPPSAFRETSPTVTCIGNIYSPENRRSAFKEQEATETTEKHSLCLLRLESTPRYNHVLLIYRCLLLEGKAVEEVFVIDKAQLLSYMKLLDISLGLIINFNVLKLTDGVIEADPSRSELPVSQPSRQS